MWNNISEVPATIRTHRGVKLTLEQANRWAEIKDAVKRERRKVMSPEAVAWSIWNREFKVKNDVWVKVKTVDEKYISNHVGNTSLIEQGRHPYYEFEDNEFVCECLKCGYKTISDQHCAEISCPECGGDMRREERPGVGQEYDEFAVARAFGHPAGQMLQAKRIIALIPKHSKFVEPFCGSATIFFSKNPTDGPEIYLLSQLAQLPT